MAKKKLKDDGIYFTGQSSEDVTGSQYFVRFGKYQCLVECGLYQSSSNSFLDAYKVNAKKFSFKPSELDFVFVGHAHIDHCGLIPRLVREGFVGQIITTSHTALIMKSLLLNSCYILKEEARVLSKKYKRDYSPLYNEADVYKTLGMIQPYDLYGHVFALNESVCFQWIKNSHCIGAAQLQLIFKDGDRTRKILYTSDLGAINPNNHFVSQTDIPSMFNDVVIMESTYGDPGREIRKKRSFDTEHLKTAVNTVIGRNGTVILPCFSFSRTQEVLATLYDIFGGDELFATKIIVDSQLSCDISKQYFEVLSGENLDYWDRVYRWNNVSFVSEKEESRRCISDPTPKIIISSSGFCTNGRVVNYLKKYLPDQNSMIVFTGYTGDNPSYLSYRVKNYKDHKYIGINKEKIRNRADCITLSTFSSHAGYSDLIRYGSSVNTNKLVLVHGTNDSKTALSNGLTDAISRNNRTHKIYNAHKGLYIRL